MKQFDVNWPALVAAAVDPSEVVLLCLKFLSQWMPEERRALPRKLQPPLAIHTPQNVTDYAFVLVQARLKEERPSPELDAMATFFAAASTRLSQLLSSKPEGFRVPFFIRDV